MGELCHQYDSEINEILSANEALRQQTQGLIGEFTLDMEDIVDGGSGRILGDADISRIDAWLLPLSEAASPGLQDRIGQIRTVLQDYQVRTFKEALLMDLDGSGGGQSCETTILSSCFELLQITPNLFTASTSISYVLSRAAHVNMSIYDVSGRLVKTLIEKPMDPGYHTAIWRPENLPPAVYFARLRAGSFQKTEKIVVLR